ncbi:MAG: type I polyketide synthase, partial [Pseudomonadota bacterium]
MSDDDDIGGGGYEIAIVGMAVRVPGANTPEEYWSNLRNGVESVQFYDDSELIDRGVPPEMVRNPDYVKAGAPLADFDQFDPDFFGFSPKEAGILDPQHRQFYECAWEAMERAGHTPSRFDGAVGVFAGCGMGAYFSFNILTNPELINSVGLFLLRHTGNDKDFLSTRVSYNFDLKGPSVNVQTACSTSAVATHLACQSLLSEECDMALAGGVTLEIPHGHGYLYKEGEILSPDGHCRAFDHRSKGTIFGSGTGVVVLRRLEDAIQDGDHIHAVILGTAVNNDGSGKVGYLAPSVDGQAQAVAEALAVADVDADSIQYVECHGTGTPVGDPIEVSALTQAFRESTDETGFCGIGSVKTNIGHLDTAAGVASLIKAALAVEHGEIPPSLNYEKPNPTIDFESSPFYVNDTLKDWRSTDGPRRAAINSLGVGGTNAFVIIEEPPEKENREAPASRDHVIAMSAKSRKSLDAWGNRLAAYLEENEEVQLSDVAYSLLEGREAFEHRRVLAGANREELIDILRSKDQRRLFTHNSEDAPDSAVFMFPGGGAQYVGMGRDLYASGGVFSQVMDEGLVILEAKTDTPFKDIWLAANGDETADREMQKPSVQLPLIFMVEYALARQWMAEGLEPAALIGHSMGENAAACLAGVMSYPDALGLVLLRGQLMDTAPAGGMLSVQLSEDELKPWLGSELDLAGVNSPSLSVASGADDLLDVLSTKLDEAGVEYQRIPINIAAHSRLLDDVLDEFRAYLNSIALMKPSIPIVSNRTGDWLNDEDAMSADYWVAHLRG